MGALLGTIIDCIEGDLSFQPDLKQEVAKTLLSLLKIRNEENYFLTSLMIISTLEENFSLKAQMRKEVKGEGLGFASIHESKIAASAFPELSECEAKKIQEYLEGLVGRKDEETLEQYMTRELGLKAKQSYDPDDFHSEGPKIAAAALAMLNSGNLEDFTLITRERVGSSKIIDIITRFYADRGYSVKEDCGFLTCQNKTESLMINMSNFGEKIMVSVMNMRML